MSIRNKAITAAQLTLVGTGVAAQFGIAVAIAPAALVCIVGGGVIKVVGAGMVKGAQALENMKTPEVTFEHTKVYEGEVV